MSRKNWPRYFDGVSLGVSTELASTPEISIGPMGYIALQVCIDNGAGAAPTDAPLGTFELYTSADGQRFTRLSYAELTEELSRIAPSGNALIDAWAIVEDVPGSVARLKYTRTSGGSVDARATINVSTW